MKYAFYKKLSGEIVSIVQASQPPQSIEDDFAYADLPDDAVQSAYHVVGGVAVLKPSEDVRQAEIARAWVMLRRRRDAMLSACDWTQVPDAPVDHAAWAAYRQQLRDLPSVVDDPLNVLWPETPR